jgi:hypothetical protein
MFDYLIEKIKSSPFQETPFKHIWINSFLDPGHFEEIVNSPEVKIAPQRGDDELFEELYSLGYQIIDFPGCISDKEAYVTWHRQKTRQQGKNNSSCEGFGMALRLVEPRTPIVRELKDFLASDPFNRALAEKFGLNFGETIYDNGIQKYLDGYEISPHPDNRSKALTYMVNINPHSDSEHNEHHTCYMRFKDRYRYVETFWAGNPEMDTCWVPWSWCETVSEQRENNSIVVFSPSCSTLHGVKANYDHLVGQRTQLYGNLFYKNRFRSLPLPNWESLELKVQTKNRSRRNTLVSLAKSVIPDPVLQILTSQPFKKYKVHRRNTR